MGQTLPEEAEEAPSTDSGSDDEYDAGHLQEHSSHMTSKVQPYAGFKKPSLRGAGAGTDDYVIDMEIARGEHASHAEAKVRPADPRGSEHREQHGAHITSKVKPADVEFGNLAQEHGAHAEASKVKPAHVEFEDVDLDDKSGRRDSKRKQD